MSLVARSLGASEEERWASVARRRGELFQQADWIDAAAAGAERIGIFDRGGCLVGGFVVKRSRRAGVEVIRNAPFCQGAGPFWEPRAKSEIGLLEERRRVVGAMAAFLEPGLGVCFVGLSRAAGDVLPFRWRGFKCIVEYTYRLPLAGVGEGSLGRYDGAVRNDIRKAAADGLDATVGLDLEAIGGLQRDALKRRGARGGDAVAGVLRYAARARDAFTVAVHRDGRIQAGCLVVGFGESAYYLLGGHTRGGDAGSHHGAGSLGLHTAIVEAAKRGFRVFDFEGSTLPRVEPFVRGFGGSLTPYFTVAKAWLPIECVLKVRHRDHF